MALVLHFCLITVFLNRTQWSLPLAASEWFQFQPLTFFFLKNFNFYTLLLILVQYLISPLRHNAHTSPTSIPPILHHSPLCVSRSHFGSSTSLSPTVCRLLVLSLFILILSSVSIHCCSNQSLSSGSDASLLRKGKP